MKKNVFQVDAFTKNVFAGNPAVVCLLETKKSDHWMQSFAFEMNLSETAFLLKKPLGYELRWFTPTKEVDLCGHATLASAWILFSEGIEDESETISFATKSGELTARFEKQKIAMEFPRYEVRDKVENDVLLRALGVESGEIWRTELYTIVQLKSAHELRNITPDYSELRKIEGGEAIVTSFSDDPKYDFISRFFAPGYGIDEDPVTGSSHCCLGPFWAQRLAKTHLHAFQASKRGGELELIIEDNLIQIFGNAVTVWSGTLS